MIHSLTSMFRQPFNYIPSPQPSRPSSKATNHAISRKTIQAAAKNKQIGSMQVLPTDAMKPEDAVGIQSYVTMIEDLVLRLQANVAVAKGFKDLEVPQPRPTTKQRAFSMFGLADAELDEPSKTYIDLWPIQMSAELGNEDGPSKKNVLTTNFDTYTLILQLGCILHTVPSWKRMYKLRVCVFVEYETDVEEERERVSTLLKNLRIQAEIHVFWLANGSLQMYEVIVNGRDDDHLDQTARDVDFSLEDERWWQDIKRLRQPTSLSASQELAHATDILEAITQWPTATFQHGRRETTPKRFSALQKMLRKAKSRASVGEWSETEATTGLHGQTNPLDSAMDGDDESAQSSNGRDDDDDADADDEAVVSESEAAISGSNFDEYDLDASSDESDGLRRRRPGMMMNRAKTSTTGGASPFFSRKLDLRKAIWKGSPKSGSFDQASVESVTPLRPHYGAISSDTAVTKVGKTTRKAHSAASSSSQISSSSRGRIIAQPPPIDEHSTPKFTSRPQPRTSVAQNETSGPSIMFVETPSPATKKKDPMADAPISPAQPTASQPVSSQVSASNSPMTSNPALNVVSSQISSPASGFPAQQAIPLSFNDLPCRAQHLILNELIRQQSDDTAVVFTTLPSPMEGTCDSESESVKYISDLEVLCQGLPPCLLVHSNSMTVTMNL